eukprot:TRINITY_DN10654_c1_g1_i5.p1 TRINITY_DN10654_c1_g1~~TRINITY_DN10654_c1_g1_i5.p1  ORF type:complete len:1090 (+),score=105.06 TRINITY_DN10654_c1_g1_i5:81-3350(+)
MQYTRVRGLWSARFTISTPCRGGARRLWSPALASSMCSYRLSPCRVGMRLQHRGYVDSADRTIAVRSMEDPVEVLAFMSQHSDCDTRTHETALRVLGRLASGANYEQLVQDGRFHSLLSALASRLEDCDARTLSMIADSSSKFRSSTPELTDLAQRLAEVVTRREDSLTSRELSTIAMSLAMRGVRDETTVEYIRTESLKIMSEFEPGHCSMLLEAFRRWGVFDRQLTDLAVERLCDEIDRFTGRDIVATLGVASRLGLARGFLLRRLCTSAFDNLRQFTPLQLVRMSYSLAKLRFLSPSMIDDVIDSLQSDVDTSLICQSFCTRFIAWSCEHDNHVSLVVAMRRWGTRAGRHDGTCVQVAPAESSIGDLATKLSSELVISTGPPLELQNSSVESPPAGYEVHKGSLYPSEAVRSGKIGSLEDNSNVHSSEAQRPSRWNRPSQHQNAEDSHKTVTALSGSLPDHKSHRSQRRNERRSRVRAERRGEGDLNDAPDSSQTAVCWLRDDLRLDDNPALQAASHFSNVICVFIHDTEDPSPWPLRGAAKWWKYRSIDVFSRSLESIGGYLYIRAGAPVDVLLEICSLVDASCVLWNRLCEPWYRRRDEEVEQALQLNGLDVRSFKAAMLWEPWEARPDERSYNRGFGSVGFYRSAVEELGDVDTPQPPVTQIRALPKEIQDNISANSLPLEALGYHITTGKGFPPDFRDHNRVVDGAECKKSSNHSIDWASEMRSFWPVGEKAAMKRFNEFLEQVLAEGTYEQRDRFRADRRWTAVLSPYIRFGELSPRRCYHEAVKYSKQKVPTEKGPRPVNSTFVRRFFWRDLAYWSLWRFPTLPHESLRQHYETERWTGTNRQLKLWQRGCTGFPLVDAAMRQLWKVGWMPNYLRHVCAQFLIEFLDISWKKGFEWFDYTLVDSDVAINAFMWQNGGHSGLDQWNFVMHPVFAAKSCDPQGDYVRRWLPELRGLPVEYIHCPWEAPAGTLLGANVLFTRTYSERLIEDLDIARRDHAREVLRVRREHPQMIAKGGNEWFECRPGYWVTLITREDFKQDTDKQITRQTADDPRNAKRRQLQDPLSLVMGDFVKQHERYDVL